MSNPALLHLLKRKSANEVEQADLAYKMGVLKGREEQLVSRGDSGSPVNHQQLRDIHMNQQEIETSLQKLRQEHSSLQATIDETQQAAAAKPAVEDILSSLSATVAQAMQLNSQPAQNTAPHAAPQAQQLDKNFEEKFGKLLTKPPPRPNTDNVLLWLQRVREDMQQGFVRAHRQVNGDREVIRHILSGFVGAPWRMSLNTDEFEALCDGSVDEIFDRILSEYVSHKTIDDIKADLINIKLQKDESHTHYLMRARVLLQRLRLCGGKGTLDEATSALNRGVPPSRKEEKRELNRLLVDLLPDTDEGTESYLRRLSHRMAKYEGLEVKDLENTMLALAALDRSSNTATDTDVDTDGDSYMNYVGGKPACYNCGKPGHYSRECRSAPAKGGKPGGKGGKPGGKGGKPGGKGGKEGGKGGGKGGKGGKSETRTVPKCWHCGFFHFYTETPCASGVNLAEAEDWRSDNDPKNGQPPPSSGGE
jgi:hypothetical protein